MKFISRFFQRKSSSSDSLNSSSELADNFKQLLTRHVTIQFNKAANHPLVPQQYLEKCRKLFFSNLDDIAVKLQNTKLDGEYTNHKYKDVNSGIFLVVTVFPWTTENTIYKLSEMSTEKPFGYINMFAKLFLNNWPSPELTHYFHVLLCIDGNSFQMHTAMGDYGGYPKASRNFTAYPGELLNKYELNTLHNQK